MEQSMSAAAGKVSPTETIIPSLDDSVGDVPPPDPTADDSVGDVPQPEPTADEAPDVSFEWEEFRKCDVSLDGSWQHRDMHH